MGFKYTGFSAKMYRVCTNSFLALFPISTNRKSPVNRSGLFSSVPAVRPWAFVYFVSFYMIRMFFVCAHIIKGTE